MKCKFCLACHHIYSCTCLDACTNNSVCKHIHLVAMKYFKADTNTSLGIAQTESKDDGLKYFQKIIASNIFSTKIICTKEDLLKKLHYRLASITDAVNNTDSIKCLQAVYDSLGNILAQTIPSVNTTNK